MSAKKYLKQLRRLEYLIECKKDERRAIWEELTSPAIANISGEKVLSSLDSKRVEEKYIKYYKLSSCIDDCVDRLISARGRIIDEINKLEDIRYCRILTRHYVLYEKLEDIAAQLNYSYDHVRHLHTEALRAFERKYPDRVRRNKSFTENFYEKR